MIDSSYEIKYSLVQLNSLTRVIDVKSKYLIIYVTICLSVEHCAYIFTHENIVINY